MFETYKNLCCRAFLTLRRNSDLIINLFSLVRPHPHNNNNNNNNNHTQDYLTHTNYFTRTRIHPHTQSYHPHTHTHTHTNSLSLTHTTPDEIYGDTRADVCGGHRLHPQCSSTGQDRARGRVAVSEGHKEMSRSEVDGSNDVENTPSQKEGYTIEFFTLPPRLL